MLWTETHLKIVRLLIKKDPRSRSEIASEIGFKNAKNIQAHLDYLSRSGYIMPIAGHTSDPAYEMNRNAERMLHLYHNRHYRIIHEEIRSMKWFIEDLTSSYRSVPDPLYYVIANMGQKSPSFFENLIQSRTPADLLERFRFSLYPFSFIPDMQEDWKLLILIHQLYADAIARDMKGGRLAEGFCNPLKEIRLMLKNALPPRN